MYFRRERHERTMPRNDQMNQEEALSLFLHSLFQTGPVPLFFFWTHKNWQNDTLDSFMCTRLLIESCISHQPLVCATFIDFTHQIEKHRRKFVSTQKPKKRMSSFFRTLFRSRSLLILLLGNVPYIPQVAFSKTSLNLNSTRACGHNVLCRCSIAQRLLRVAD